MTEENAGKISTDTIRLGFIGSPLLDITANCDQNLLDQYDLSNDDCVRAQDKHDPLFQNLFQNSESYISIGGSALNTALFAKWVLRDEGEVFFAGCTGDDKYGAWIKNQLLSDGVAPLFVQLPSFKTGVCVCLLSPDGKRSMCTRHGASSLFSTDHLILPHIHNQIQSADCVFVVGYFAAHSLEVILKLKDLCLTQIFSLSLSAEYVCRDHAAVLMKVMPRVDVLFGNEAEVKAFARAIGGSKTITVEESILMIRQLPRPAISKPRIVIITCGSDPVIVDDGSNDLHEFKVPKDVKVVDSVGCGDALAGAFLATYIRTKDVSTSIHAGIQAAMEMLQIPGCRPPKKRFCIGYRASAMR